MKRVIILLFVFLITGCTASLSNKGVHRINNDIKKVLTYEINHTNTSGKGFKYYKPRDFSLLEDKDYNHVLIHNGDKYYLNIDINAYYSKFKSDYKIDNNLYYSDSFLYNDIFGYVEIIDGKNDYFYIKMLYNYSCIEVSVTEDKINDAVSSMIVILSSIKYNDTIIESLISSSDISSKDTAYELVGPLVPIEDKNILDVYEYDTYE